MVEVKSFANKTPRWVLPTALLPPQKHLLKLQERQFPLMLLIQHPTETNKYIDPLKCAASVCKESCRILLRRLQACCQGPISNCFC